MFFDSTSSSTNPVTTVSGGGSAAVGKGSQTVASGSIGVSGSNAKYQESGAVNLEKGSALALNSPNYASAGNLTINNGNDATTLSLSQQFTDAIANVSKSGAQAASAIAAKIPVATDGKADTSAKSSVNWQIIGALAAVLGVIYAIFFRKKTA